MSKCVAERWVKAEATCAVLNEGLRGTRTAPSLNMAYVASANSILFPSETATLSPRCTPRFLRPCAREVDCVCREEYVRREFWCEEITLVALALEAMGKGKMNER